MPCQTIERGPLKHYMGSAPLKHNIPFICIHLWSQVLKDQSRTVCNAKVGQQLAIFQRYPFRRISSRLRGKPLA